MKQDNRFIRLKNNGALQARNAADSADLDILRLNASNIIELDQDIVSLQVQTARVTQASGSSQGYDMPNSFGTRGAESFTPGVGFNLAKMFWRAYTLQASGQTGNIRIAIYSDNAGTPNTLLGASDDLSIVGLPAFTQPLDLNFTFSTPVALSSGTQYWWAIEESTGFGGTFRIGSVCTTVGAGGAQHRGWNGSSWTTGFQTYTSYYTMYDNNGKKFGSSSAPFSELHAGGIDATGSRGFVNIDALFLQLPKQASDPTHASLVAGAVYYNTTTNKIKMYNGSTWETVTSA